MTAKHQTASPRETILAAIRARAAAPALVRVPVPEWNEDVYIRRLNVSEKFSLEQRLTTANELPKEDTEAQARWRVAVVIEAALDETGTPIFSLEDEALLLAEFNAPVERVVLAYMRLNSVPPEELERLGKESPGTRNGASRSASAGTSG